MTKTKLSKESEEFERFLDRSITYGEYRELIDSLLESGKTTGPDQSEPMVGYGRLNRQRMHRLDKTVDLNANIKEAAKALNRPLIWLTLTEGWCADAAQNIPVIEKIAEESDLIATRYLLRDEHPALMERYLTDGAKSIPKLICLDAENLDEVGVWGSRPKDAQDYFIELKKSGLEKPEISEKLQRWYLSDKGEALQREFAALLASWSIQLENHG